jgi:hypothetical protein
MIRWNRSAPNKKDCQEFQEFFQKFVFEQNVLRKNFSRGDITIIKIHIDIMVLSYYKIDKSVHWNKANLSFALFNSEKMFWVRYFIISRPHKEETLIDCSKSPKPGAV